MTARVTAAVYKILLIALGGAVGSLARFGTSTALARFSDRAGFPLGTLGVNVIGCFLIGYFNGGFAGRWAPVREEYRLALLVGFLGGYTTFSAFGWETAALLREQAYVRAAINVLASNVAGIGAVIVGYAIGRGR